MTTCTVHITGEVTADLSPEDLIAQLIDVVAHSAVVDLIDLVGMAVEVS